MLHTSSLLILAEGRGSELVREGAATFAKNISSEIPYSRTSSLPRPAGRSSGPQGLCLTMSA
ncbi:hypothetical protein PSPTOT1_5461 [Pseudomonas syringae pv. tomato T1]|nr:hypothetical protein PSPTOT1_5461 [Pseudomonas syringae pv. tomato T1]